MKRTLLTLALTAATFMAFEQFSHAQSYAPARNIRRPVPLQRSAVSPYLNLIQFEEASDVSMPVYQTLVRPFVDQRRLNQFQVNQVYQLQQQVAHNAVRTSQGDPVRRTGHMTSYQNHSHYFPNLARPR